MTNGFVMQRRVEFMDTDMAGIAHYTAYFRYMETAEHELFRSLGLAAATQDKDRHMGWPRVSCGFDFTSALCFQDAIEVHIGVTRIGTRSVSYRCEVLRGKDVIASGHTTSVCCQFDSTGRMQATDIPVDVADQLKPYVISPEKRLQSHD